MVRAAASESDDPGLIPAHPFGLKVVGKSDILPILMVSVSAHSEINFSSAVLIIPSLNKHSLGKQRSHNNSIFS